MAKEYAVGYRKPPKATQFKKGRSGNSQGRPKGTHNLKTDLEEELQERVAVSERGRKRQISKQRLLIKALMAKALQGDHRAFAILMNMVLRIVDPSAHPPADIGLSASDKTIIERFLARNRIAGADIERIDR